LFWPHDEASPGYCQDWRTGAETKPQPLDQTFY
jgi:hypothetical protein